MRQRTKRKNRIAGFCQTTWITFFDNWFCQTKENGIDSIYLDFNEAFASFRRGSPSLLVWTRHRGNKTAPRLLQLRSSAHDQGGVGLSLPISKVTLLGNSTCSVTQMCFGDEKCLLLINSRWNKSWLSKGWHWCKKCVGTEQPCLKFSWVFRIGFVRISEDEGWTAGMTSQIKDLAWRWVHLWKGFQAGTAAEPFNGLPKKSSPRPNVFVLYVLTVLTGIYIARSPYQIMVLDER